MISSVCLFIFSSAGIANEDLPMPSFPANSPKSHTEFKANFHRLCLAFADLNVLGNQSYSAGQKRFDLAKFYEAIQSGEMVLTYDSDDFYYFRSKFGNGIYGQYDFFVDGSLRSFMRGYEPKDAISSSSVNLPSKLDSTSLEYFAHKAIGLTTPALSPSESVSFGASEDNVVIKRPRHAIDVVRFANQTKWGPGAWARVVLEDFSGRVESVTYYTRINDFEPIPTSQVSDEDQQGSAAQEILTRYQIDQITYGENKGRIMTNASFLGGYLKNNPRTQMLRETNRGVLATQFTFGDAGFPSRYAAVTDVATGQTLSLGSYVPMGNQIGTIPVGFPSKKSKVKLFEPKVTKHEEFSLLETKKLQKKMKGSAVMIRFGKTFFKAEKLSKNRYRIQNREFLVQ